MQTRAPPASTTARLPAALLALLLVAALAGCTGGGAPEASGATGTPDPADAQMAVVGIVQDAALAPVAGANVTLRLQGLTQQTDAAGRFAFEGLPVAPYLVDAVAAGFRPATLTASPRQGQVGLAFVLERAPSPVPYNFTQHFEGVIQCAAEVLIVTPSCDSALEDDRIGGPSVVDDNTSFFFGVPPGWTTVVLSLDFEASAHPGFEGMRITLRGKRDVDSGGDYDQYGRFNGAEPFSVHILPNATYPEGTQPVPANLTAFQADTYAQGHGWHLLCKPPFPEDQDPCPLGAGVGLNVQYHLYVTAFYVEPAPPGWSFLA